ncbi:hypothetical protein [Paracoccus sp. (in: a-proteobacteria)]|uniref:hypothetical protein n=1 Tax=Paracoccus sp. TaxID=267 RepID=UPI00289D5F40|nr:hypothetical protein [Paracoccus sp. (in: a-proteobacteria)]
MSLKTLKMGRTTSEYLISKRPGFEGVGLIVPPKAPNECDMVYYSASAQTCFQDEAGLIPVVDDGNPYPVRRINGIGLDGSDLVIKPYQSPSTDEPMLYMGFSYMKVIIVQADCYAESAALQKLFSNRSYLTMMMKASGAELTSLSDFRDIPVIGFTAGSENIFKVAIGAGHCPAPRGNPADNLWEWKGDAAAVLRWKDTPVSPAGDNALELGCFDRLANSLDVFVGDLSAAARQPRAALRMNTARNLVDAEIPAYGRMGRNLSSSVPRTSTAAGVMKFEAGSSLSALAVSLQNFEMYPEDRAAALAWMTLQ